MTGVTYAQSGGGTFTLTDIPATLNGKHVIFFAYDDKVELIGALSYNLEKDTGTLPRIVNGRVSIPVWIVINEGGKEKLLKYNGNNNTEIDMYFFESAAFDESTNEIEEIFFKSVRFTNGSATVSYSKKD